MQGNTPQTFEQQLHTLQIIIGAMAMGSLTFAVIMIAIARGEADDGVLTKIALVLGFGGLLFHGVVARFLKSQVRSPDQKMQVYFTATIVSAAILEGVIFLNLIAHFLEKSSYSLGMAALLWASLLLKMPTRGRVEAWLSRDDRARADEQGFND